METEAIHFILKNILPVLVPVLGVGYKMYHDVGVLNKMMTSNKQDFTDHLNSLDKKVDKINTNIGDLETKISNNRIADEYRDKEITRLDKEIGTLKLKVFNGGRS